MATIPRRMPLFALLALFVAAGTLRADKADDIVEFYATTARPQVGAVTESDVVGGDPVAGLQVPVLFAILKFELAGNGMSGLSAAERARLSALLDDPAIVYHFRREQSPFACSAGGQAMEDARTIYINQNAYYDVDSGQYLAHAQVARVLFHELGHVDDLRQNLFTVRKERWPTSLETHFEKVASSFSAAVIEKVARGLRGEAEPPAEPENADAARAAALAAAARLLARGRALEAELDAAPAGSREAQAEAGRLLDAARQALTAGSEALAELEPLPAEIAEVATLTQQLRGRSAELEAAYRILGQMSERMSAHLVPPIKQYAEQSATATEDEALAWKAAARGMIEEAGRQLVGARAHLVAVVTADAPLAAAVEKAERRLAKLLTFGRLAAVREVVRKQILTAVADAEDAVASARAPRPKPAEKTAELDAIRRQIEELLRPFAEDREARELLNQARALGSGTSRAGPRDPARQSEQIRQRLDDFLARLESLRRRLADPDAGEVLAAAEEVLGEFDAIRTAGAFSTKDAEAPIELARKYYGQISAGRAAGPPAPPELTITALEVQPGILEPGKEATVRVEYCARGFTGPTATVHLELWADVTGGNGTATPAVWDQVVQVGTGYSSTAKYAVPAGARAGPIRATAKLQVGDVTAATEAAAVIKGVTLSSFKLRPAALEPGKSVTLEAQYAVWGFREKSLQARIELWADVTGGNGGVDPWVSNQAVTAGNEYTSTVSYPVPPTARPGPMKGTAKVTVGAFAATAGVEGVIKQPSAAAAPAPAAPADPLVGHWVGTATLYTKEGKKTTRKTVPVNLSIRRAGAGYIVRDEDDGEEARSGYATASTIGWNAGSAARWDLQLTAPGRLDGTFRMVVMKVTTEGPINLTRR